MSLELNFIPSQVRAFFNPMSSLCRPFKMLTPFYSWARTHPTSQFNCFLSPRIDLVPTSIPDSCPCCNVSVCNIPVPTCLTACLFGLSWWVSALSGRQAPVHHCWQQQPSCWCADSVLIQGCRRGAFDAANVSYFWPYLVTFFVSYYR